MYPVSYLEKQKAFSLIEISIVLVIIGLIIAGIVGGQQLIENSKTTSTIVEIGHYDALSANFKSKYKVLPGDDLNLQTKFRASENDPAVDKDGNELHNGNNDGFIGDNNSDNPALEQESLSFFQTLYLSKILEKNYTGQIPTTDSEPDITKINKDGVQHYPTSKLGNDSFLYIRTDDFDNKFEKQTRVSIGVPSATKGSVSTRIAKKIDKKGDDDNPLTGKIITMDANTAQAKCLSSNGTPTSLDDLTTYEEITTATYNVNISTKNESACIIMKNLNL